MCYIEWIEHKLCRKTFKSRIVFCENSSILPNGKKKICKPWTEVLKDSKGVSEKKMERACTPCWLMCGFMSATLLEISINNCLKSDSIPFSISLRFVYEKNNFWTYRIFVQCCDLTKDHRKILEHHEICDRKHAVGEIKHYMEKEGEKNGRLYFYFYIKKKSRKHDPKKTLSFECGKITI